MQDTIEGYVEHIIFRNEDNGYTVLNLMSEGSEITCVGVFEYVSEGELLELHGTYVEHATYGQQLKVESYETKKTRSLWKDIWAPVPLKALEPLWLQELSGGSERIPCGFWTKNRSGLQR